MKAVVNGLFLIRILLGQANGFLIDKKRQQEIPVLPTSKTQTQQQDFKKTVLVTPRVNSFSSYNETPTNCVLSAQASTLLMLNRHTGVSGSGSRSVLPHSLGGGDLTNHLVRVSAFTRFRFYFHSLTAPLRKTTIMSLKSMLKVRLWWFVKEWWLRD